MATEESALDDLTVSETFSTLADAYEKMPMPIGRYLSLIVVPSVVFFLASVVVVLLVPLPLLIGLPVPLLGLLVFGTAAIYRFARPICYQNFPQESLPPELCDGNPRGIWRTVDGTLSRD